MQCGQGPRTCCATLGAAGQRVHCAQGPGGLRTCASQAEGGVLHRSAAGSAAARLARSVGHEPLPAQHCASTCRRARAREPRRRQPCTLRPERRRGARTPAVTRLGLSLAGMTCAHQPAWAPQHRLRTAASLPARACSMARRSPAARPAAARRISTTSSYSVALALPSTTML